jgi:DNA-binding transcriptional ArsR family regulator
MTMNNERARMPSPNRMVHEPARLAILTVLSSCASADFVFLQGVTGLSKGNLSVQLTNLEQAGLVIISKEIIDKRTRTTVRLAERAPAEIEEYWRTMDEIRARTAEEKQPQRSPSGPAVPRPATLSPEPAG